RIRSKINDEPALVQASPIFRTQYRTAPRRQDDRLARRKFGDDLRFAFAKSSLALQFEDDRNARARTGLDFVIAVEERPAEPARHGAAHGRLTCPHEPHEENV